MRSVFSNIINEHNFCILLNQSVDNKLNEYIEICMKIIKDKLGRNANNIINGRGFRKMKLISMKILLQSDYLLIDEEDLFKALMKWNKYQIIDAKFDKDTENAIQLSLKEVSTTNNGSSGSIARKRKLSDIDVDINRENKRRKLMEIDENDNINQHKKDNDDDIDFKEK